MSEADRADTRRRSSGLPDTAGGLRVAFFGAGAVGAYYGARLADGGADVTLIARGRQLEALRRDPLTIVEPEGTRSYRLAATDNPFGHQSLLKAKPALSGHQNPNKP